MTQEYEQTRQKKMENEPGLLQKKEQLIQLKEIERKKETALQEKSSKTMKKRSN